MKILFVGDVFGSAGRRIVREHLPHVRETHQVDLTVINGENAAGGFGITPNLAEELFDLGADVITTGNHVWDKRELIDYMKSVPADSHERARRVLRPANLQHGLPGYGVYEGSLDRTGTTYAVVNLMGRVFMNGTNDPFNAITPILDGISNRVPPRSSWSTSTPRPPAKRSPWAGISTVASPPSSAPTPTSPQPTSVSCPAAPPIRPMSA